MSPTLKNPFGLRDGILVTAEDVLAGLACDCTCPSCGAPLIARHGDSGRQSHFAHHNTDDCGASYETAAHMIAKEILHQTKAIMLPCLDVESSREIQVPGTFRAKERLVERHVLQFEKAQLEMRMKGRIPDVVLYKRGRQLLVEIVVSHDMTAEKLLWIREKNFATIRVSLTWSNPTTLQFDLRRCLSTGYDPHGRNIMLWAHHPMQLSTQERLNQSYLKSVADGTVARPMAPPNNAPASNWSPPKRDRSLFD